MDMLAGFEWTIVVSIFGGIAAIFVFLKNILSTRKLQLEIQKLQEQRNEVHSGIKVATLEEIQKYGRSLSRSTTPLLILLSALLAGTLISPWLVSTDKSEYLAVSIDSGSTQEEIDKLLIRSISTIEKYADETRHQQLTAKEKLLLQEAIDNLDYIKKPLIDRHFGKGSYDWWSDWMEKRNRRPSAYLSELSSDEKIKFESITEYLSSDLRETTE